MNIFCSETLIAGRRVAATDEARRNLAALGASLERSQEACGEEACVMEGSVFAEVWTKFAELDEVLGNLQMRFHIGPEG